MIPSLERVFKNTFLNLVAKTYAIIVVLGLTAYFGATLLIPSATSNPGGLQRSYKDDFCGTKCGMDDCYDRDASCDCCEWGTMECCCNKDGTNDKQKNRTTIFLLRFGGLFLHDDASVLDSLFLGPFGVDRFALGYSSSGAAKMLTIGGLGIWWIADAALIGTGVLHDGQSGCPLSAW